MENHKTSGGNHMSSTKNARAALFAAASSAAWLAAALAPGEALAQCVPAAPAPGQGADTLECASSTTAYSATGIAHTASGDLTVNLTGSASTNLGAVGVALTAGDADDNITFNRTGGGISGSGNTAAALVNLQTQGGDIRMDINNSISGNANNVQYGIRAQSSGAGDIRITSSATGTATVGTGTAAGNPGQAAIWATSNGGDIRLESTGAGVGNVGLLSGSGRLYGVLASTTGAGSLYFRGTASASSASGVAALDLSTQAGNLIVETVGTGSVAASSAAGIGVRLATQGGNATLSRLGGSITAGPATGYSATSTPTVIAVTMTGGVTTIDNTATSGAFGHSNANLRAYELLRASGSGSIVFNNTGSAAYGRINLQGFDGTFTLDNRAGQNGWSTVGLNVFSGGDDTVVNASGGVMVMAPPIVAGLSLADKQGAAISTTLRFGAGEDRFTNAGTLAIGTADLEPTRSTNYVIATTLAIEGLESFENSGDILFGAATQSSGSFEVIAGQQTTDGFWDDLLVLRDSHWDGLDGSRIFVDAFFNGTGQAACTRNAVVAEGVVLPAGNRDAHFAANDCLDLQGSQVSGQTLVVINNALPGDRGAYNPAGNVVVDARGGVVDSPTAFVLSPASDGYNPALGVIDQGLFVYALGFEAEDGGDGGQFRLYGLEGPFVQQLPLIVQAAGELWRGSTDGWIERRGEQRASGEPATGLWMRGRAATAEREAVNVVMAGDTPLSFDNSFTQDDRTATVGIDFAGSAWRFEWVAGGMFGYARSVIEYDAFANLAELEGAHAGLYLGLTMGRFWQDLVVNAAVLDMDNDVPALNLVPAGTVLNTSVQTLGGRYEAGWRFDLGRVSLEPLASLTWLKTTFDDLTVPADDPSRLGGKVGFDEAGSLRGGLGVRLGMDDLTPHFLPLGLRLTARAVEERDGEATVRMVNVGPDVAVVPNTFDGTFGELNGTVVFGDAQTHVSGFLSLGGEWGENYVSRSGALGVRVAW